MFSPFSFRSGSPSHIDTLLRLLSWTSWHRDELILAAAVVCLVVGIFVGVVGAVVVLHSLNLRKGTSTDSASPVSVSVHQSVNNAETPRSTFDWNPAPTGLDTSVPPNRAARLRRGGGALA